MANQPGLCKLYRLFAVILAFTFTFLVVVSTVVPHAHDCGCVRSVVSAGVDSHAISESAALCPLCEWQALAFTPVSAPVFDHHVPIVSWKAAAPPVLVRVFGLVEPLHSPQRGPPAAV